MNKPTIGQVLWELEEAMHHHLHSPVEGDLMSLTRAWRWILETALLSGLSDSDLQSSGERDAHGVRDE